VKIPWPLLLAWKQLFPTQRKVSFFSLLAVIGVALGVNVMIVVVAFMKGFQQKFREDIVDAQGHARAIPLGRTREWQRLQAELLEKTEVSAVSPYLQGPVLVQKREDQSIPLAIGLDLTSGPPVLPLDEFLANGQLRMQAHAALDVTPVPSSNEMRDDIVFVTQYVANRLGVRPGTILRMGASQSIDDENLGVVVLRLDADVPSAEWNLSYSGDDKWKLRCPGLNFEKSLTSVDGILDAGSGTPVFKILDVESRPEEGAGSVYQTFAASTIELYSPAMIERAQSNEMIPPKEVRVGGVFEVPWQGFHAEAMIGSFRMLEDLRSVEGLCDGMFIKFSSEISGDENVLRSVCEELEKQRSQKWAFVPWFVENAWFFDLLKFEEYLMILIMVPIGLVAAFAIAIALMTTVLRKIREIGLLVAMGGTRAYVGSIFCLQGFLIGLLGSVLGCGLALLFIRYRDAIMSFIVVRIAGDDGKAGVAQFYDFYSLNVPYPWDSHESASTFITFTLFAVLVSTFAGLVPAWRASRMNPADALRNE
jgi:ABC-type lipoprotein release transport system permease subunit